MAKIVPISQLDDELNVNKFEDGCLIDTNTLFAFYHPDDDFYRFAKKVYSFLSTNSISVYTNVNIKSEFIDLFRRFFIRKGLLHLYESIKEKEREKFLDLMKELKSLGKKDKFYDTNIKEYRKLLSSTHSLFSDVASNERDDWESFCSYYLSNELSKAWSEAKEQWNMDLLSYKTDKALFIKEPEWKDMISFVEKFGIGSSDAMILNFFLCSKIPLLLTADRDLLYTIEKSNLFKNKIIAIPDTFI